MARHTHPAEALRLALLRARLCEGVLTQIKQLLRERAKTYAPPARHE